MLLKPDTWHAEVAQRRLLGEGACQQQALDAGVYERAALQAAQEVGQLPVVHQHPLQPPEDVLDHARMRLRWT